jgi:hypothetical protein
VQEQSTTNYENDSNFIEQLWIINISRSVVEDTRSWNPFIKQASIRMNTVSPPTPSLTTSQFLQLEILRSNCSYSRDH